MKACSNTIFILVLLTNLLSAQADSLDLWSISQVLVDTSLRYTPAEVLALPDGHFQGPNPGSRKLTKRAPTYLRFQLPQQPDSTRFLFIHEHQDSTLLFDTFGLVAQTGKDYSPPDRSIPRTTSGLKIPAKAGTYLLKLTDYHSSYKYPMTKAVELILFSNEGDLNEKLANHRLQQTPYVYNQRLFITLLAVMLGLILLSWAILRQAVLGYYAGYFFSVFLFYFIRRINLLAIAGIYLVSQLYYTIEPLWILIIVVSYAFFIRSFLDVSRKDEDRRLHTALHRMVYFAGGAGMVIVGILALFDIYGANTFSRFTNWIILGYAAYIAYLILLRKDRYARILGAGICLLVLGYILTIINDQFRVMWDVDIEPPPFGYFQYSILGELTLYWTALLYRWYDFRLVAQQDRRELVALQQQVARQAAEQEQQSLNITTPRKQYKWARTQVQGFAADGEITHCLLSGGQTIPIPLRLGGIIQQLPNEFIRVQRSYVINSRQLSRFEGGKKARLYLMGWPEAIPVGKAYQQTVAKLMS